MIFLVFLFNIMLCTFLIFLYTKKPPITDDECIESKIQYYKLLRYLLYIYAILYVFVITIYLSNPNINISNYTNILLIIFGIITTGFTLLISANIYPKKVQCFMNGLSSYISLLPLLLMGIISIFLGYLGGVIEKCKV